MTITKKRCIARILTVIMFVISLVSFMAIPAEASSSKLSVSWKFSSNDIRVGDKFKAYLKIEGVGKNFELKPSDIGTIGIGISEISGEKGNYTISCQANEEGTCLIGYMPTGTNAQIKVEKALKMKINWSLSTSNIRKGDLFKVYAEFLDTPKGFTLSIFDIGTYGIDVKKITKVASKYIIECLATEKGNLKIGYLPTNDIVNLRVNKKVKSDIKCKWDAPIYVQKGQFFTIELTVKYASSSFKLKKKNLGTYGVRIDDIKKNGNKYLLVCKATESGQLIVQYIPTKENVIITSI